MSDIIYRTADEKWDLRSGFGNHRFIVTASKGEYVKATLPWRRRDLYPGGIGIRVRYGKRLDGVGCEEVHDVSLSSCTRDEGVIVFRAPADCEYEIYYMPYVMPGEWYAPDVNYMSETEMTPNEAWLRGYDKSLASEAQVISYESRTKFDSFYPMEMPMTASERAVFSGERTFTTVAESRLTPVRMKFEIPFIWNSRSDRLTLNDSVYSNEHYVFQVAVCAKEELKNVKLCFTDANGAEFYKEDVICFNLDGVDTDGKPFKITRDLKAGEVLPLWCGVKCENFADDELVIYVDVTADNTDYSEKVTVTLKRINEELTRNGDDELWRLSRLFWLNDTIGTGNEAIRPYAPVEVSEENGEVSVLGRKFTCGKLGLPVSVKSYFNDFCLLDDKTEPIELLRAPISLEITENGNRLIYENDNVNWIYDGTMQSRAVNTATVGKLNLTSEITYECDGHIDCKIDVCAASDGDYTFELKIPMNLSAVRYMMGMCREGGDVPSSYVYRWNENFDGNEVWFGSSRIGMQIKLMQEEETWHGADPLPRLWGNSGKGILKMKRNDALGEILFEAITGNVKLIKGQKETLHFHLIVTPFHEINYKHHFTHHYYHKNPWNSTENIPSLTRAKELGTHTVILHQGSALNENINYPFILADKIKSEVQRAHDMGLRYKLYYTVRELSNYTAELWPLFSLGDEIFKINAKVRIADYFEKDDKIDERPDGGPWLVEHLVEGFTPAWHQSLDSGEFDCAIRTQAKSRWHNYYLKGLDWLIRVVGIDGIYLDGIGYDRHITRRVRRIMEAAKPGGCDIDIHCGNEHNPVYGNGISSCIYLEHFAYADSIWNGEGFDCTSSSPDNFFTEMCGIPFGLMGEMLERGGNAFRGMLYGMSARCGWSQGGVSTTLWRSVWDKFGIGEAKMYGYWHPECPVTVDNDQVKATVYVKDNGDVLICLASWFPHTRDFRLSIDTEALGITGDYELYAPKIENMRPTDRRIPLEGVDMNSPVGNLQEEAVFPTGSPISISPAKGMMLFLVKK